MTKKDDVSQGITGLINGLSGLLGSLGDLAEKGEQLEQLKRLQTKDGREMSVHSSLRVRTLDQEGENAGSTPQPEPIERPERVQTDAGGGSREPLVDIFEEDGGVTVIAEMPGIPAGGASISIDGDVLTIEAQHGQKQYRGETLLPRSFDVDAMSISANAGVFEIRLAS